MGSPSPNHDGAFYFIIVIFSVMAVGGFAAAFGAFGSDQKNAAANNAASLARQRAQMEPVNTSASYPPIVSAVPAGGKGKGKSKRRNNKSRSSRKK